MRVSWIYLEACSVCKTCKEIIHPEASSETEKVGMYSKGFNSCFKNNALSLFIKMVLIYFREFWKIKV